MAAYSGNADLLKFGSTDISALYKTYDFGVTVDEVDVTAGSNTTWRERNAGLKSADLTITITYDRDTLTNIWSIVDAGDKVTVEIGPEGNTTGYPRHVQSFLCTEVAPTGQSVEKDERTFVYTFMSDGAPSTDMFNAGVY
jgi:hypothetical protein